MWRGNRGIRGEEIEEYVERKQRNTWRGNRGICGEEIEEYVERKCKGNFEMAYLDSLENVTILFVPFFCYLCSRV